MAPSKEPDRRLYFWSRIGLVLAVATVAALLFREVPTTDHPIQAAPLHEALYRSLSLFAISAQGMPAPGRAGTFAYVVLWLCYFMAPALTATFAADAVRRLRAALRTPERAAATAKDHVIVCGYGKHGRLLLELVLTRHGFDNAVVIDHDSTLDSFVSHPRTDRAEIPVLREDLATEITGPLRQARIDAARMLVAATGNDVLNVAVCLAAREIVGPGGPHLLALIADDTLEEGLRDTLRKINIRTRNTYQAAARSLLRAQLSAVPGGQVALVIIGCGRFGTALAQAAQALSVGGSQVVHIGLIDYAASKKINILRDTSTPLRIQPLGIEGDAEDPETLSRALSQCPDGASILVALCTDNDATNLRLTFRIERQLKSRAILLTRTFDSPPESVRRILEQNKVQFFELNGLIAKEIDGFLARLDATADAQRES